MQIRFNYSENQNVSQNDLKIIVANITNIFINKQTQKGDCSINKDVDHRIIYIHQTYMVNIVKRINIKQNFNIHVIIVMSAKQRIL